MRSAPVRSASDRTRPEVEMCRALDTWDWTTNTSAPAAAASSACSQAEAGVVATGGRAGGLDPGDEAPGSGRANRLVVRLGQDPARRPARPLPPRPAR